MSGNDDPVVKAAALQTHAGAEDIDKAFESNNSMMKTAAAGNKNISKSTLHKAMADPDKNVVTTALDNPRLRSEHLTTGLNNKEFLKGNDKYFLLNHKKINSSHIDHILDNIDPKENYDFKLHTIKHPKTSKEQIKKFINSQDKLEREVAAKSNNAEPEDLAHIATGPQHETTYARENAIKNKNFPSSAIHKVLNQPDIKDRYHDAVLNKENLEPEHLTTLFNSKHVSVNSKKQALQHSKINEKHLDQILSKDNSEPWPHHDREIMHLKLNALDHGLINKDHITKALDDTVPDVRRKALERDDVVDKEHIKKALKDPDLYVRAQALKSEHTDPEDLDKAVSSNRTTSDIQAAVANKNITDSSLTRAINMNNFDINREALDNPNLKAHHISQILSSEKNNQYLKEKALQHPNASEKHLDDAMESDSDGLKKAALNNPNVNERHLSKALEPNSKFELASIALKNKNINLDHLHQALNHKEPLIREQAVENPLATNEILKKAIYN